MHTHKNGVNRDMGVNMDKTKKFLETQFFKTDKSC